MNYEFRIMDLRISRAKILGLLASLGLLLLYGITMSLLSGWQVMVDQFKRLWLLMLPVSVGFGIQVGLYMKIKEKLRHIANPTLATSGTSAGVSMLACCAHHATDVLPILGLSAVSIFLSRYQIPILLFSLGINVFGIIYMFKHLQKLSL